MDFGLFHIPDSVSQRVSTGNILRRYCLDFTIRRDILKIAFGWGQKAMKYGEGYERSSISIGSNPLT
jgi:hypothetical protein